MAAMQRYNVTLTEAAALGKASPIGAKLAHNAAHAVTWEKVGDVRDLTIPAWVAEGLAADGYGVELYVEPPTAVEPPPASSPTATKKIAAAAPVVSEEAPK